MNPARTVPTVGAPVPTFTWNVTGVEPESLATVPTLRFGLEIGCREPEQVNCIALAVSVRIAAPLRDYDVATRQSLRGVFGIGNQWRDSLRDLVWAQPVVLVPRFTGQTTVEIPVPCGQDVDLASVSYLGALRDGDVPLRFLFTGTVFHTSGARLATAQLPWDGEATYRMPATTWHELRQRYFGRYRWLRLDEHTFERLHAYRTAGAFASPEAAIESLLPHSGKEED